MPTLLPVSEITTSFYSLFSLFIVVVELFYLLAFNASHKCRAEAYKA